MGNLRKGGAPVESTSMVGLFTVCVYPIFQSGGDTWKLPTTCRIGDELHRHLALMLSEYMRLSVGLSKKVAKGRSDLSNKIQEP